jgi:hypothetical protein
METNSKEDRLKPVLLKATAPETPGAVGRVLVKRQNRN